MKNFKINFPPFVFIIAIFIFLISFDNKKVNQDCQSYLIAKNKDLRHVNGLSNATAPPYEKCVNSLQSPGAKRIFMIDSYKNLLDYCALAAPGKLQTYKKSLHLEIKQ